MRWASVLRGLPVKTLNSNNDVVGQVFNLFQLSSQNSEVVAFELYDFSGCGSPHGVEHGVMTILCGIRSESRNHSSKISGVIRTESITHIVLGLVIATMAAILAAYPIAMRVLNSSPCSLPSSPASISASGFKASASACGSTLF